MSPDDILFAPIYKSVQLYKIWFVPQSYHDDAVKSAGEFVLTELPLPMTLERAREILNQKHAEGFDVNSLDLREYHPS